MYVLNTHPSRSISVSLVLLFCRMICFFSFQADIRESGTLTEHELSDAMRSIMGSTPKAGETSRVLRFFGQPGAEGEVDRAPGVVRREEG